MLIADVRVVDPGHPPFDGPMVVGDFIAVVESRFVKELICQHL